MTPDSITNHCQLHVQRFETSCRNLKNIRHAVVLHVFVMSTNFCIRIFTEMSVKRFAGQISVYRCSRPLTCTPRKALIRRCRSIGSVNCFQDSKQTLLSSTLMYVRTLLSFSKPRLKKFGLLENDSCKKKLSIGCCLGVSNGCGNTITFVFKDEYALKLTETYN